MSTSEPPAAAGSAGNAGNTGNSAGSGGGTGDEAAERIDYEASMRRLEVLVRELEDGSLTLDQSIKSFEEGMQLVRLCAAELHRAEQRVKELTEEAGRLRLTDFAPEED